MIVQTVCYRERTLDNQCFLRMRTAPSNEKRQYVEDIKRKEQKLKIFIIQKRWGSRSTECSFWFVGTHHLYTTVLTRGAQLKTRIQPRIAQPHTILTPTLWQWGWLSILQKLKLFAPPFQLCQLIQLLWLQNILLNMFQCFSEPNLQNWNHFSNTSKDQYQMH